MQARDDVEDRSAELALVEEALEACDEERRRGEQEICVLRECLGEVAEWCEGIEGVRGFERVKGLDDENVGDVWDGDESLRIPHPHLARPATSFAPVLHAALHHIRTKLVDVVDLTEAEVEAARAEMADALEAERVGRIMEQQVRIELERELEDAQVMIKQGQQLVNDFASERFLAGVGGGQVYGDESVDDIDGAQQQVDRAAEEERTAAAAKLVRERSRIEVRLSFCVALIFVF